MKKIAISACLLGNKCRYDAGDNKNEALLADLEGHTLISFCPEDAVFGTPRPTMDLIHTSYGNKAISNQNGLDLSSLINQYAIDFFDMNADIDLFIGKDRSPSCAVCSGKLYDEENFLLSSGATGLMTQEALVRQIKCVDAEDFKGLE